MVPGRETRFGFCDTGAGVWRRGRGSKDPSKLSIYHLELDFSLAGVAPKRAVVDLLSFRLLRANNKNPTVARKKPLSDFFF
jgi:hypothetical protein